MNLREGKRVWREEREDENYAIIISKSKKIKNES